MTQASVTDPTTSARKSLAQPPPGGGALAGRLWPRNAASASLAVLVSAAVATAMAVVTDPFGAVGVAGIVTGIAVLAVPAVAAVTSRAASRRLLRALPLLAAAAALALLAVGTFRAATWLYVLCVMTAAWLISYTLAGGRRWPGVLFGGGAALVGLLHGRLWLSDGVRTAVRSARTALHTAGEPRPGEAEPNSSPAGETTPDRAATSSRLGLPGVALLTASVLVVFGSLLASADDEFAEILSTLLSAPPPDLGGRLVGGIVVGAFALGTAYVALVPPRLDKMATSRPRPVRPFEWAIPAGALVLLFAVFTVVQFTTLFGGEDHLNVTEGLTYATYARSGFGELVAVTVLTLGVLAAVSRWAPRRTLSQRHLLRVIAGAICGFTLVIVASALYRMDLYQEAYGLTRLRLVVTTFELCLGVVFVLLLIAGIRLRAAWLPRVVVGTAVAALLGLAALNPDAYIAERNAERFEQTGRIDVHYLGGLSADAVPVLTRLPEPERSCALRRLANDLPGDEPWAGFNVSRERARSILDDHPIDDDALCVEH